MNKARLDEILNAAAAKRLLVLGDVMLDEFLWGKVGRISPEAPVPVVEVMNETRYPGGAANVARNLREFANDVAVIGMIGADPGGERLRALLDEDGIQTADMLVADGFRTIVKTRIIARQQQVVRVDRERIAAPAAADIGLVVARVAELIRHVDAVIFEDYGKGFLTAELVRSVAEQAKQHGRVITADPNPRHPLEWRNMTAVKPNRTEAFIAAGVPPNDSGDDPESDKALRRVGETLLEKWQPDTLLITLGEQGMMLFRPNESPHHIPTQARQVFDVSGAGDTAIGLFTLALTGGASPIEAAEIANHASAVVVGKLGTATVSPEELRASFAANGGC